MVQIPDISMLYILRDKYHESKLFEIAHLYGLTLEHQKPLFHQGKYEDDAPKGKGKGKKGKSKSKFLGSSSRLVDLLGTCQESAR